MAKIKTLYQNGQQIMPVTHPKAVMDDEGETLEVKLSKINKRLEACGNGGSMSGQLVGSASGTSFSVSDALAAPFVGLRVWGKSTQSSVPTPTTPVTVVNAGDAGAVTVIIRGKNLFDKAAAGSGWVNTSGVFTAGGDNIRSDYIMVAPNTKYSFLVNGAAGNVFVWEYDAGKNFLNYRGNIVQSFVSGNNVKYIVFAISLSKETAQVVINTVQMEKGESTAYELYKERALTLQTPGGLPGIPVTSGGNYTDENGQQWVCDEVDLARGVRVQRITKIKVTSSLNWQTSGKNVDRYFAWFSGTYTSNVLCTHFSTALGSETVGGAIANQNNLVGFAFAAKGTSTLDDFKAFLDANDVYIWSALESPAETALSSAEIAAYKALTTYAPTTVIGVSGGAGATVTYQRDAILVIKRLEEAIASTAAVSSLSMQDG